ncbi:MAG: hypothetical protein J6T22_09150 [Bacteroidales bacterium]|nr:hypothetical protein [Bacteroidales bacterium]
MIRQGFSIGKGEWRLRVYYNVRSESDLKEVADTLVWAGCRQSVVNIVTDLLAEPNHGYTFTTFSEHLTLMFMSHATSPEQMYDTIQHELKHATEHISEYYGVEPKSEEAAYLQGEIARKMFKGAALAVCPKCNNLKHLQL